MVDYICMCGVKNIKLADVRLYEPIGMRQFYHVVCGKVIGFRDLDTVMGKVNWFKDVKRINDNELIKMKDNADKRKVRKRTIDKKKIKKVKKKRR